MFFFPTINILLVLLQMSEMTRPRHMSFLVNNFEDLNLVWTQLMPITENLAVNFITCDG